MHCDWLKDVTVFEETPIEVLSIQLQKHSASLIDHEQVYNLTSLANAQARS